MNRTFLNYLRDNGYNKQFNQAARDFLRNEGYEDQLNQALFKWLGSEGYEGPLAKRLADWSDNYSFVREYAVNSFVPPLVLDAGREQYATGGKKNSFDNSINFTRSSEATYIDREGLIQTANVDEPRFNHEYENGEWVNRGLLGEPTATNLLLNSASLSTQSVTVSAQTYTLHFTGTGTVTLSGASTNGPLIGIGAGEQNRVSLTFTPSAGTLTLTVSGSVSNAQLEAGQVSTSYIPTAGSTVTRAADEVVIPAANLTTNRGTELVTNGTFDIDVNGWTDTSDGSSFVSWGDERRIEINEVEGATGRAEQSILCEAGKTYLIQFQCSDLAILRVGSDTQEGRFISSAYAVGTHSEFFSPDINDVYIYLKTPSGGGSSWFDSISVREVSMPSAVSFAMKGRMSYADTDQARFTTSSGAGELNWYIWSSESVDFIYAGLQTAAVRTGQPLFAQRTSNTSFDDLGGDGDDYSPGLSVPFSIASRHGATFINGAVDGTTLTANTTPTALADLSTTDLLLAPTGVITIEQFLMWPEDIGDIGIEEASS